MSDAVIYLCFAFWWALTIYSLGLKFEKKEKKKEKKEKKKEKK